MERPATSVPRDRDDILLLPTPPRAPLARPTRWVVISVFEWYPPACQPAACLPACLPPLKCQIAQLSRNFTFQEIAQIAGNSAPAPPGGQAYFDGCLGFDGFGDLDF